MNNFSIFFINFAIFSFHGTLISTWTILIITGSDHGVKAQGEGWVLTVALIEGTNLASLVSEELPDPYVVLTCNGKTRTSSVKLQTLDPQWNGMSYIV